MHDRCPDVPAAATDGCPPPKHTIVVGGIGPANLRLTENIFFKRGTSTMMDMGQSLVDEIVHILRSHPTLGKVAIQGHATPDEPRALQLSEARARLVRDLLIGAGIEADRLITEGVGASQPRVPNTTPDNRNRNRRVDFDIRNQASCPPKP